MAGYKATRSSGPLIGVKLSDSPRPNLNRLFRSAVMLIPVVVSGS